MSSLLVGLSADGSWRLSQIAMQEIFLNEINNLGLFILTAPPTLVMKHYILAGYAKNNTYHSTLPPETLTAHFQTSEDGGKQLAYGIGVSFAAGTVPGLKS